MPHSDSNNLKLNHQSQFINKNLHKCANINFMKGNVNVNDVDKHHKINKPLVVISNQL